MRLFVALELTEEVRAAVRALVARLEPAGADVRWVRPEGMHLTLKFIGEAPEEKRAPIEAALERVGSAAPAALDFQGLGFFPNERAPRVLWVGIRASANLAPLAADIEAALEPLGIAREQRAFSPHLTLGRFRSSKGLPRLREEIARLPGLDFGRLETREFALYQTRLAPGGAQYARLRAFPFVGAAGG